MFTELGIIQKVQPVPARIPLAKRPQSRNQRLERSRLPQSMENQARKRHPRQSLSPQVNKNLLVHRQSNHRRERQGRR